MNKEPVQQENSGLEGSSLNKYKAPALYSNRNSLCLSMKGMSLVCKHFFVFLAAILKHRPNDTPSGLRINHNLFESPSNLSTNIKKKNKKIIHQCPNCLKCLMSYPTGTKQVKVSFKREGRGGGVLFTLYIHSNQKATKHQNKYIG